MTYKQYTAVRDGIISVLNNWNFKVNTPADEKHLFVMETEIGEDDRLPVMLHIKIDVEHSHLYLTLEIAGPCDDVDISNALEAIGLINRLPITGHFFIVYHNKTIAMKRDLTLACDRLNRKELIRSIGALFETAIRYYPLIMEYLKSGESIDSWRQLHKIDGNWLHPGCLASNS